MFIKKTLTEYLNNWIYLVESEIPNYECAAESYINDLFCRKYLEANKYNLTFKQLTMLKEIDKKFEELTTICKPFLIAKTPFEEWLFSRKPINNDPEGWEWVK